MATFTDKTGRAWELDLDFDLADRVKAETGLDLIDVTAMDKTFAELNYGDPRVLLAVLWGLVRDQAAAAGVDLPAFRKAINSQALMAAADALAQCVAGFSPRSELAQVKLSGFRSMAEAANVQMVSALGTAVASATTPGSSPASPGSTPSGTG